MLLRLNGVRVWNPSSWGAALDAASMPPGLSICVLRSVCVCIYVSSV